MPVICVIFIIFYSFTVFSLYSTIFSGRSKGYGFVEMEDEAEQQKVLDEMKTVTVDGREVSIKVSVSVPHSEETATEDEPATATTDAE
jgi:RNA recognition motif-containing protein